MKSLVRTIPRAEEQPATKFSPRAACFASVTASTTAKRKLIAAGKNKATRRDFRYQGIAEPEELGNGRRIRKVSSRQGEAPAYAGTDFIIARDGRIATVYLFFDKLPQTFQ
jgi:hypothetical protein